jgi:hypothetical protein
MYYAAEMSMLDPLRSSVLAELSVFDSFSICIVVEMSVVGLSGIPIRGQI